MEAYIPQRTTKRYVLALLGEQFIAETRSFFFFKTVTQISTAVDGTAQGMVTAWFLCKETRRLLVSG
jgi:hypothetical protein